MRYLDWKFTSAGAGGMGTKSKGNRGRARGGGEDESRPTSSVKTRALARRSSLLPERPFSSYAIVWSYVSCKTTILHISYRQCDNTTADSRFKNKTNFLVG